MTLSQDKDRITELQNNSGIAIIIGSSGESWEYSNIILLIAEVDLESKRVWSDRENLNEERKWELLYLKKLTIDFGKLWKL